MGRAAVTQRNWLNEEPESRIVLRDVSWSLYEELLSSRGENQPGIRFAYLDGALEIVSTSRTHEVLKKNVARMLEAYAIERNIPMSSLGQATVREKAKKRGLEPNDWYFMSERVSYSATPDLAIEIVLSRLDIDKLAIYAGLGVKEVWLVHRDRLEVHVRRGAGYRQARRSKLLPDLDLDQLLAFASREDQLPAVREYRDLLRS